MRRLLLLRLRERESRNSEVSGIYWYFLTEATTITAWGPQELKPFDHLYITLALHPPTAAKVLRETDCILFELQWA